ncbi:phospholipase-like protein [Tanacetum coccineum]
MSSVEDVIIPIEQSNAITPIEESNASNHILTNLTDPTDALKVYDAKVTISVKVDFKSKEDTLKFDIGGYTLNLGSSTPVSEKVPRKYKRPKGVSYNVKGLELLDFIKDDEKWKNISDVDIVRHGITFLEVWILETFLNSQRWWFKDDNVFPRCLAWGDNNNRFEKQNYRELLGEGSNPKVRLTATPDETNQEWWKILHEYLDESLSAYENVENSENEQREYADLDKGVSSGADVRELSGEEIVKEDKHSIRELELERLLRHVESRLHTVEMESTKLKEELAYLRKENDAPHEKVNQEISYAADALHTMALDEDAKVCMYIRGTKPSTTLHSDIPADDVHSIAFDDDAKDTGAEYMNEELHNRSQNKEPLSKQPYVPFRMHTRYRDYQPLDKQPEDKLDTVVVDETADKQVADAKTIKMINVPKHTLNTSRFIFLLNEPNIHWSLAELHISSGVITFYDSLGPGKEPEERDWWVNFRKCLSLKIPTLMTLHGVFRKKDIDPKHYTITFKQAQNASRQGLNYGDCGVWV